MQDLSQQTDISADGKELPPTDRPLQSTSSRWYLWYFALGILNLTMLIVSVGLNNWLSRQLLTMTEIHSHYGSLLEEVGNLRTTIIEIDAPGNAVFVSRDPDGELLKLKQGIEKFHAVTLLLSTLITAGYDNTVDSEIAGRLPIINSRLSDMTIEALQVFSQISAGHESEATVHMSNMDKINGEMLNQAFAIETTVMSLQRNLLAEQGNKGKRIQLIGIALIVLTFLTTGAAGVHGYRMFIRMKNEMQERDRYTQMLSRARDQAEQTARIKSQFLANMSHEIRTPMNGVIGMLEALNVTHSSPEQAELLKTARLSANILMSIIDDILDFSKIEAGMLLIESIPVSTSALVSHISQLHQPRAEEKLLTLRTEIDHLVPEAFVSDPTRLTQILSNFVSNAIKFTAKGEVAILVSARPVDNKHVVLRFAVKDTGIGITEEAQRNLFNAFTQADNSTSRRFGGTGLGLAICKQLTRLLDPESGKIGVNSFPDRGSEFYIELKVRLTSAEESQSLQSVTTQTTQIEKNAANHFHGDVLVVEDNETNQRVILMMLGRLGIKAALATDGKHAVAQFQKQRFDLVFMDFHMPEMDGFDATMHIRKLEAEHGWRRTPVIAMTASVMTEDRERAMNVGMDDIVPKPVRQANLIQALSHWLQPKDAPAQAADSADNQQLAQTLSAVKSSEDVELTDAEVNALLDVEQIEEMRSMTGDAFQSMVHQFYGNAEREQISIRNACEAMNANDLKRAAHKLKGSSGSLGFRQMSSICQKLESAGASGKLNNASALVEQLQATYQRTLSCMDRYLKKSA